MQVNTAKVQNGTVKVGDWVKTQLKNPAVSGRVMGIKGGPNPVLVLDYCHVFEGVVIWGPAGMYPKFCWVASAEEAVAPMDIHNSRSFHRCFFCEDVLNVPTADVVQQTEGGEWWLCSICRNIPEAERARIDAIPEGELTE